MPSDATEKHDRGSVVLVTGASSGIGLAVADALHKRGWVVIGASRRGVGGAGWQHEVMDVRSPDEVTRVVGQVIAEHGGLDAVVCCAGNGLAGPVETTPVPVAREQLETNFWGAVHAVAASLESLRLRQGRVVLVSSVAGALGLPFQAYYSASKFALEGWAEALAWEVEPFGVRVTLVQPGNFRTGFTSARVTGVAAGCYQAAADAAIGRMEHDEQHGPAPDAAAEAIVEVLEHPRPPLRRTVGLPQERAGVWARRFLPFWLFKRLARSALTGTGGGSGTHERPPGHS
jgi:NAD(P)-dependent dehydrogenase (short-subunit alcohol dehydrogenase family)